MADEIIIIAPCPGAVNIDVPGVPAPVTVDAPTLGEDGPKGDKGDTGDTGPAADTQAITSQVSTYAAAATDATILCSGTFTVTLPTAVGIPGKFFRVKNTGTGTVTVTSPQNLDTASTVEIGALESLLFVSDGTQYWIN